MYTVVQGEKMGRPSMISAQVILKDGLPFVKVGGVFLAMKAGDCREELDAAGRCITLLGGRLMKPYRYTIPGTDLTRQVIRIEKIAPTPEKYPRRFAKIQKAPL